MKSVCFYFQVHQPHRLKLYRVFDIGRNSNYFDKLKNKQIMEKVAKKCYLPTNNLVHQLIKATEGKFKVAYSITGTALEQFEKYVPAVIDSFKELSDTGCVEFLSETYYHSLSFLYSKEEFKKQVEMHRAKIQELFGQTPKVFRNTELIFNNELANYIEGLGYEGILAEGADHVLGWRSPNFVYRPKTTQKIRLLLKNYKLSDDIAFRFSNRGWKEWPLTTEKFASWADAAEGITLNFFMDYETFGEHQWEDTGIFNFMRHLPKELFKRNMTFKTPSEIIKNEPIAELDIHSPVSWADVERDLSAWLGNKMQHAAINELYALEKSIKNSNDAKLIQDWRKLQTSDHFYYMCTKWFADGDVHKYFNPYDSPYDSYMTFMNILNDLAIRLKKEAGQGIRITERPSMLINR
ncbi:glycoside hydrolase family 57 protein [Candidatus Woesearchaeota archaeon]|nr:glycoside hydrolase family 57 protein [Candidatus Woesearchaeota archaeon]